MALICLICSGMIRPAFVPSSMVSPIIFKHEKPKLQTPSPHTSLPLQRSALMCVTSLCASIQECFRQALSHWDVCALISLARKRRLVRHCSASRRWSGLELFSCYDIIAAPVEPGLCPEEIRRCHVPNGWLMNRPWCDITVTSKQKKGGSRLPLFFDVGKTLWPFSSPTIFYMLAYSLSPSLWNMLINTLYVGRCSV